MREITVIMFDEHPISWNRIYAGLHYANRKAEADRVHLVVRAAIDPDWEMFDKPVAITVTGYFKDKRVQLDVSNIPAKLYEDGLIGWLIEDDSPKYVRSMTKISLIDRDNPRVEIKIKEMDDG